MAFLQNPWFLFYSPVIFGIYSLIGSHHPVAWIILILLSIVMEFCVDLFLFPIAAIVRMLNL
jgi:hypothetical protein